jgi:hypothetical protein
VSTGLRVGAGVLLFAAALAWMTLRDAGVACEVCAAAEGRVFCATVRGPDAEAATEQAHAKACGSVANGMTQELACQRAPAHSVSCRE